MAFVENISLRDKHSKTYEEGGRKILHSFTTPIHRDSSNSGVYDSEVNFYPNRVTNPAGYPEIDGFAVTDGDYRYAIQTEPPTGNQQPVGTFFFGGRNGQAYFSFRLAQLGYMHWPTRTFQGLQTPSGGIVAPTYTRANLSSVFHTAQTGVDVPVEIIAGFTATWTGIWTTPAGGSVDIVIHGDNNQLKIDVVINREAREWIQANRPPTTPATETYLTQVFRIDWSGIDKLIKRTGNVEVLPTDDVSDDGSTMEFRDALDRVLAFMPVDYLYAGDRVIGSGIKEVTEIPLRKRFYQEGGQNYFLVGARVDEVVGTAPGKLVFDPTFGPSEISATAYDYLQLYGGGYPNGQSGEIHMGDKYGGPSNGGFQFPSVTIAQGETINSASIEFKASSAQSGNTVNLNIYCHDDLTPTAWQDGVWQPSNVPAAATTNSPVAWSAIAAWSDNEVSADTTTPDIAALVDDIISQVGWSSGGTLSFAINNNASSNTTMRSAYDYASADGSKVAARLTVDYGGGGGLGIPIAAYHFNHNSGSSL